MTASTNIDRITPLIPPLVLLVLGWAVLHVQGYFVVDDAYISFRYAANLAQGHGLVWNPGEAVEGYTNLLWVLLLTPFALLGLDLTLPSAILGALAACGCLEVLRRVSRRALPHRSLLVQMFPCMLLAINPTFVFWSTGGMETPLFCLWVLLSVHLLLLGRKSARRRWQAGLTLSAACLTRPEGLLVCAVLFLAEICMGPGSLSGRLRRLLAPGLLVAVVVALHLAFRLLTYGDLLPNTFYAKVILCWTSIQRGLSHLGWFLAVGGYVVLPGIAALFGSRRGEPLRSYLVHGYLLLAVYTAYLIFIGGDVPWWFRFYLPLMPLPLLGFAELAAWLGRWLERRLALGRWTRSWRGPLLSGMALYCLAAPAVLCWRHAEPSASVAIGLTGRLNALLNVFFFKKNVPEDSLVAASAIGMLGYYSSYRIIDTWGLTDRHISRVQVRKPRFAFAHDKTDWFYVLKKWPDFIFTFRGKTLVPLKGYDICWPTRMPLGIVIYRRNVPLTKDQLTLGMPPGQKRTLILPPKCAGKRKSLNGRTGKNST
jgi:arabinofuranosyltransferase